MPQQADVTPTIVLVHGAFADASTPTPLAPREGVDHNPRDTGRGRA